MRTIRLAFIIVTLIALGARGDQPSSSASVVVSIEIQLPSPGQSHGHVPIASPAVPRQGGVGVGLLPGSFMAGELDGVDLIGGAGGLSLPIDRLWLRCGDTLYPLPTGPISCAGGPPAVEFCPGWRDAPGTYRGRLVARTATGERTVDLEAEVPAFVAHEVIADRLTRDVNDGTGAQVEVKVTSNARTWRLMFDVETIVGDATGIEIAAARPRASWRVSDGVVVGRGPVDAEVVTIKALGAVSNDWQGVVKIVDVSAR